MTATPRISVVVPCHNYGRFLGEALESVLAQALPPTEIVVVDDGSSDDTLAVASRYPVRVISRSPARGAPRTFNDGVAATSEVLFTILSADDRLHPRFLEATAAALSRDPGAAFAYVQAETFGAMAGQTIGGPFNARKLRYTNYLVGTALMRREAWDRTGGYALDLAGGLEDWDLWLSYIEHGMYGVYVPEVLFLYRRYAAVSRNTVDVGAWFRLYRQIRRRHPRLFRGPQWWLDVDFVAARLVYMVGDLAAGRGSPLLLMLYERWVARRGRRPLPGPGADTGR
ncbi:MAG: glycosyltransferase family 2 protein [Chloroflexi bacterium]|nr:glycosyltransferase family 2 protein [Chloroflexota bacterium]